MLGIVKMVRPAQTCRNHRYVVVAMLVMPAPVGALTSCTHLPIDPNEDVNSMHHRPEISGLRALAVLCVVVFHLFPQTLPGGFIGVDVFFVLSGFLIAQVVARGIEEGSFSLRGFYRNRMRRLFPAMAVVSATTLGLGYLWLLPYEYQAAAKA